MINHIEGNFRGCKDRNLYYQCWLPDSKPNAILLIVHGLAEHSGRYQNLVNYFVPRNFAVYSFDLTGHGKSEGKRCYVDNFSEYAEDLKIFFEIIRTKDKQTKIFLVGHSMGSTIAVAYALNHQRELDGLIFSAASLVPSPTVSSVLLSMAGLLSALVPKMGVTIIDASLISRDQKVVDAYITDPLVFRGKIPARGGAELARMWKVLPPRLKELTIPLLILHGSADRLSNPAGSKLLYTKASSEDKTLKLYDGFYHEVFNDPQHIQVLSDAESWLLKQITS